MTPSDLGELTTQPVEPLRADQDVRSATQAIVARGLPALPVVDGDGRYCGIFGEREFIGALFPGYVGELTSARFVPRSIDALIDKRSACATEPIERFMNTEHIDVGPDFSDVEIAETFLHHRVLIIPVVDAERRVSGVITRSDFFRVLVERFGERT